MFYEDLKKLNKPKFGVYAILGNHDYGDYVEWTSQEAKMENLQNLKNIHQKIGWNLLLNENIILEKKGQKNQTKSLSNGIFTSFKRALQI